MPGLIFLPSPSLVLIYSFFNRRLSSLQLFSHYPSSCFPHCRYEMSSNFLDKLLYVPGMLVGYKVQIKGNGVKIFAMNATTTTIMLNNLTAGGMFTARVAAMTTAGQGPFSSPVPLLTIPRAQSPRTLGPLVPIVRQTWFVVLLSVLALVVFAGIGGVFYLRRRQTQAKQLGHLNVPVVNATQLNAKESLWIDRGWRAADCDKDSSLPLAPQGPDYAEVDTRSLSTFYNCRKSPENPTPYATTMILPPPSWSELIPPPPDHPPPHCPEGVAHCREAVPAPPPRGGSSCGSNGGYTCWPAQPQNASQCNRPPQSLYHPRSNSCSNCDAHCSLASGSSGRRSNSRCHYQPQHTPCEEEPNRERWRRQPSWEDGDADVETDRHSCSSSHETCCSCSESSCLYAEAGPSVRPMPSSHPRRCNNKQ